MIGRIKYYTHFSAIVRIELSSGVGIDCGKRVGGIHETIRQPDGQRGKSIGFLGGSERT